MILPRGFPGIAFGEASDGDLRADARARSNASSALGIPEDWAFVDQVHGTTLARCVDTRALGEADAIFTQTQMLPIAVATADCVPVAIVGNTSRVMVHAGWRGVAQGIVQKAVRAMEEEGDQAHGAVIGPHIGPCCYEVGPDVVEAIGGHGDRTRNGMLSADLGSAIREQLGGIDVGSEEMCTMHDPRFHSYRRDATTQRQVAVAWIPQD